MLPQAIALLPDSSSIAVAISVVLFFPFGTGHADPLCDRVVFVSEAPR